MIAKLNIVGFASLALVAFVGCQNAQNEKKAQDDFFQSPQETPLMVQLMHTQAARGAAGDATLFDQHFSGSALNSLGRTKLDLMLADTEAARPLKVYVAGQSTDAPARSENVRKYMTASGLASAEFEVLPGVNPGTWHPVDIDPEANKDSAKPQTESSSFTPTGMTTGATSLSK